MAAIPTVKIKYGDTFARINECDFNPDTDKLYDGPEPEAEQEAGDESPDESEDESTDDSGSGDELPGDVSE